MKITKDILLSFAKFLFRSGEEAFRCKGDVSLDSEISAYVKETFKNFLEKERKIQEAEKIEQEDFENETYN